MSSQYLFAQHLKIDTKNSLINWTGHAEIGSYAPAGTLNFSSGQINIANGRITDASLTIDMKSMQQENTHLLEHLKSEDFFDVEKYQFSSINITRVDNNRAYGQLTIKGKTKAFSCPVSIIKTDGKLLITGSTTIDRTAYGITYNSGSFFSNLGDKAIRNTFDITFKVLVIK